MQIGLVAQCARESQCCLSAALGLQRSRITRRPCGREMSVSERLRLPDSSWLTLFQASGSRLRRARQNQVFPEPVQDGQLCTYHVAIIRTGLPWSPHSMRRSASGGMSPSTSSEQGGGSDMRSGRIEWRFHTVLTHLPTNSSCCGALDNLGRINSNAPIAAEGDIRGCVLSGLDTLKP